MIHLLIPMLDSYHILSPLYMAFTLHDSNLHVLNLIDKQEIHVNLLKFLYKIVGQVFKDNLRILLVIQFITYISFHTIIN